MKFTWRLSSENNRVEPMVPALVRLWPRSRIHRRGLKWSVVVDWPTLMVTGFNMTNVDITLRSPIKTAIEKKWPLTAKAIRPKLLVVRTSFNSLWGLGTKFRPWCLHIWNRRGRQQLKSENNGGCENLTELDNLCNHSKYHGYDISSRSTNTRFRVQHNEIHFPRIPIPGLEVYVESVPSQVEISLAEE